MEALLSMATSDPKVSLNPKVSLKLLVDTKANRVLFAEADKKFVDFLFNLLSLPLGTVITILSPQSMVGSVGKVYESVENLSDTYKKASPATLEALLKPKLQTSTSVPLLPPHVQKDQPNTNPILFYSCNSNYNTSGTSYVSDYPRVADYVKDVVTYMIMDDLEVRPMSMISNITMLNKFNVKDIGLLEEKVVDVGINEGVELLRMSLQSKAVLTEVFLKKKAKTVSVSELD